MKLDGEANRRAWKQLALVLAFVFTGCLGQTHSFIASAAGVAGAAPLLFVIPPVFMSVQARSGSNFLAGAAALSAGIIYLVTLIWLCSRMFVR